MKYCWTPFHVLVVWQLFCNIDQIHIETDQSIIDFPIAVFSSLYGCIQIGNIFVTTFLFMLAIHGSNISKNIS